MTDFETRVCPTGEARQQFAADCREIFITPAGQRVLARLCIAQHPLAHWPGMPDHAHGNAEVVATLWRYGSTDFTPPEPEPKPNEKDRIDHD